jgi:hypothetical protein
MDLYWNLVHGIGRKEACCYGNVLGAAAIGPFGGT